MTTTTHQTQTQWTVQELERGKNGYEHWNTYCVRDAKTNVHIATVGDMDRYFEADNLKHARLIAQAPALLEALKACVKLIRSYESPQNLITSVQLDAIKLINEIEGRE